MITRAGGEKSAQLKNPPKSYEHRQLTILRHCVFSVGDNAYKD